MNDEASRIWIDFHDHVEQHLRPDGAFAAIPGLANKAAEHASRLAATMTLWRDLNALEIEDETMADACTLVEHYLSEGLRLRSMTATNGLLRLAQRVLDWLQGKWSEPAIYPAVIYNDCPIREVRDRKKALRIIQVLEEHGYLLRAEERVYIGSALRKEAWLIHGRNSP